MTINWTEIFEKYKGMWIALAEDEKTVVASSKNAGDAYEKAKKKGVKVPIMFSVPREWFSRFSDIILVTQFQWNSPEKNARCSLFSVAAWK